MKVTYPNTFRTHFLRVGKVLNESEVAMVELKTLQETILTYMPLFRPYHGWADHRKTCSIDYSKQMNISLIVLAKHMIQNGVVLHTYDFETDDWSRAATNIEYFGMLKKSVSKLNAIISYFQVPW